MDIDLASLAPSARYKLLTGLVVPRPIALVTTTDPQGRTNAAPYSFFNLFSHDPALVVLGIERRRFDTSKDTGRNIDLVGEFVVHLVDEELAEAMAICAVDFPPEVSEPEIAGLELVPCRRVAPRRILRAPAALECRCLTLMRLGRTRELVIGEILWVHAREGLVDPTTLRVDLGRYRPVGRLFGDLYCRIQDIFALPRPAPSAFAEAITPAPAGEDGMRPEGADPAPGARERPAGQ
ncbi:hypothetical protein HRbin40_02661 [bacterium HR40]|nr:hypothetical protein HRbin40_02661 [bacterium HR40]